MKRLKWLRAAAAFVLAAAIMAAPCWAVTIGGATVTGSEVRLRTSPDTSTDANILLEMDKGAFLLVEERLDGWYKAVYNGVEGYVSADFAAFAETAEGTYAFDAATGGTDVNLRAAASTGSAVVKNLRDRGTALTVTGVCGQWLRVTDAAGAVGYIRSDLLRYKNDPGGPNAPAAPVLASFSFNPTGQTAGDALVQTALFFEGYAYTWGGMSPLNGFDCSGFVNYVCSQHGISLHRVAQDIYTYDGVLVGRDELQPGDILCFGYGPWSVGHVGLYIGDGRMIHASTSLTGVIISDVTSGYYYTNLVGAKRVV